MVDALQRAATSTEIGDGDIDAVAHNVAIANGMASDAHHSCSDFNESCLGDPANLEHDIVLRSIGPLSGVDRLLEGQELKFALEGVTMSSAIMPLGRAAMPALLDNYAMRACPFRSGATCLCRAGIATT
jgi:hypothetical protein